MAGRTDVPDRILETLAATPGGTSRDALAERLGVSLSTVKNHVARLHADGLVTLSRRTDPGRGSWRPLTWVALVGGPPGPPRRYWW